MKKLLMSAIAAIGLVFAAVPVYAGGKLSIYHWFEYIPQELLDKFSKEHDVEVTMDTYDSNEALLAALKAGALGQYDVAVPGDNDEGSNTGLFIAIAAGVAIAAGAFLVFRRQSAS